MIGKLNRPVQEIKNILIIDDNQSISKLLSRFLNLKGIEHTISSNGQNGLSLIRQGKFDVILLDINMPDFSGYDVIDSLEKEGRLKDENIFLFTASNIEKSEEENLLKRGIVGCAKKPIRVDELLKLIGI
ncbi:MAG: response regulator [Nitrosarchaeum sp.]|nr:response regulator [Nitrosarchaeum sp.]